MVAGQTKSPVAFIDIRKQIIWGNKHITFENKPIVFENWIKGELIYVNDILDSTKHFIKQIHSGKAKV